jgi:hypothetical protein
MKMRQGVDVRAKGSSSEFAPIRMLSAQLHGEAVYVCMWRSGAADQAMDRQHDTRARLVSDVRRVAWHAARN